MTTAQWFALFFGESLFLNVVLGWSAWRAHSQCVVAQKHCAEALKLLDEATHERDDMRDELWHHNDHNDRYSTGSNV